MNNQLEKAITVTLIGWVLMGIFVLQKIRKDKVSLYALQDTLQLDAVLNDLRSSSEERVLARLSHHPVIVKYVKQYRDPNPNWDKQIPVLLQMTREKRGKKKENPGALGETPFVLKKTEKKAVVKEEDTDEDSGGEDNSEEEDDHDIEENDKAGSSDVDEDESEDDVEEEDNEEEEEAEDIELPIKQSVAANKSKQSKAKPVLKKAEGKPNTVKNLPVNNDKKSSASQNPLINKSEGTVKVQFLTDLNELEEEDKAPVKIDITQAPKVKKPKSGFFVGGVDEPEEEGDREKGNPRRKDFQNSVPFNKNQNYNNGQEQNQFKPIYKKGKLISKPPPRSQGRDFNPQQNRRGQERPFGNNSRFGGNAEPLGVKKPRFSSGAQEDIVERPSISGATTSATSAEKLHPSWEAKKKQQQISLTEFKGKKIVFGDDD